MSKMLQNPTKTHLHKKLLSSLISTRPMGGGPRTFPGGLTKWEWRRLHEKKARDKEQRLLDQEKQLYQARLRNQIRASSGTNPGAETVPGSHTPVSPKEHVKALADRFVKAGAEDLWNESDGPINRPVANGGDGVGVGVGVAGSGSKGGNFQQVRGYCCGNSRSFRVLPGNFSGLGVLRSNFEEIRGIYSGNSSDFESVRVLRGNLLQKRGYCSGNLSDLGNVRVLRNDLANDRVLRDNWLKKKGYYSGNSSDLGNVRVLRNDLANDRVLRDNLLHKRGYYSGNSSDLGNVWVLRNDLANVRVFRGNLLHKRGISSGNSSNFDYARVLGCNLEHRRGYSIEVTVKRNPKVKSSSPKKKKKNGNSSSDDDEDYGPVPENARWPKFKVEENVKEMKEEERGRRGAKGFLGSGVLGKYTVKKKTRSIMKELEDYVEEDYEGEGLSVEEIKKELMERKMRENAVALDNGDQSDDDDDEVVDCGKRFDQCGISPLTVQALADAGYFTMSKLQEEVISLCLEGKDVLVNARPGMGKTAAFLLPAIETVLKAMSSKKVHRVPPIYVVVLCPIRELACQIAAEARVLLKYHDEIGVQALVGGGRFKEDLKRIETEPCQILIATPGRLLDHIESRSGLSVRLMGLKMLVLDEADRVLDLGFRTDVERIADCVPRRRQSLVFSETVPKEVRRISQLLVNREHACVNAVGAHSPESSFQAKQSYYVAPHTMHFEVVYQLLKEHITKTPDYKVIVFCNTGVVASLLGQLFREMKLHVKDIHARKAETFRNRIYNDFKITKRAILVSSDAPPPKRRNYPDVTLVIQVGIPSDREQYIDRIRRTGRGGKHGEGILVLAPWEEYFFDEIKDLNIERLSTPLTNKKLKMKMDDAMTKVDSSVKESAYHDWLSHYSSNREIGRDKTSLVERANEFSESIGLEKPPRMVKKALANMGLVNIPGIRLRY